MSPIGPTLPTQHTHFDGRDRRNSGSHLLTLSLSAHDPGRVERPLPDVAAVMRRFDCKVRRYGLRAGRRRLQLQTGTKRSFWITIADQ